MYTTRDEYNLHIQIYDFMMYSLHLINMLSIYNPSHLFTSGIIQELLVRNSRGYQVRFDHDHFTKCECKKKTEKS